MTTSSTTVQMASPPFKEVWIISVGHALTHWYIGTFFLLLPLIGKELGLNYAQIGLIMSLQYLAGALSNIPGGMVVDTIGRKGRLMAIALFWVGLPYALMAFTQSYGMLLACVMLVGIGNNLWHPTAIPTLAQRFPTRKGLVLSIHGMGGNLGEALAPLVVGAMLVVMSWRTVVIVNVLPGLAIAAMILVFLGTLDLDVEKKSAGKGAARQSWRDYFSGVKALFANRGMLLIATSGFFRSMTQSALLTFLPVYLAYELGYSPFWVGMAMFALNAAGFAAAPVAGYLSDKMGRAKIMTASMSMTAVVLVSMALAGKSPAFIALVAVLGFFMYSARPVMQAWALEVTPKRMAGTSVGMLFGLQAAGSSVSPFVGGMIADAHGIFATFYFLAGTIVVANLFILFMPKEQSGRKVSQS